jgi:hypothetical protein
MVPHRQRLSPPVHRVVRLLLVAWQALVLAGQASTPPDPEIWTYSIVAEYPHDRNAFTQGEAPVAGAWKPAASPGSAVG